MGLRFLGLGSAIPDLADLYGVSVDSSCRVINVFLDAIDFNMDCPEVQVPLPDPTDADASCALASKWSSISTIFGLFNNTLGAIDGWLPQTEMPGDVTNQTDYFSGHYQCYGLNIQAMCDPNLIFLYVAIAAPGKVNDIRAFHGCQTLIDWLKALLEQYFILGDNAYPLYCKILVLFSGSEYYAEHNRTFNFYLSQLRIRIEMAFGRLTTKWKIGRAHV